MAYDRYDPRDERSRWRGDRNQDRRPDDDRGFFERAGDEVASWFGDEEAERRRREDRMREEREGQWSSRDQRGWGGGRSPDPDRHWNENRGAFGHGGPSERDYSPGWQRES